MKQSPVSTALIASAVLAALGAAFLYFAAYGDDRAVLYSVLWKVGCALGCFSLALQPQALFERVSRQGLQLQLPKVQGVASLFNVAGLVFIGLAVLAWITS